MVCWCAGATGPIWSCGLLLCDVGLQPFVTAWSSLIHTQQLLCSCPSQLGIVSIKHQTTPFNSLAPGHYPKGKSNSPKKAEFTGQIWWFVAVAPTCFVVEQSTEGMILVYLRLYYFTLNTCFLWKTPWTKKKSAQHHFPPPWFNKWSIIRHTCSSSLQSESSEVLTKIHVKIQCTEYLQNNQEANHLSNLRIAFQVRPCLVSMGCKRKKICKGI